MINFPNVKLYMTAICADVILFMTPFMDIMDEGLKRISILCGICVAVLTIVKLYNDIKNSQLDKKQKRLQLRREEEETRRFFEQKYSDK